MVPYGLVAASAEESTFLEPLVNLGLIHRDGEWQPYWEPWIAWMREQGCGPPEAILSDNAKCYTGHRFAHTLDELGAHLLGDRPRRGVELLLREAGQTAGVVGVA